MSFVHLFLIFTIFVLFIIKRKNSRKIGNIPGPNFPSTFGFGIFQIAKFLGYSNYHVIKYLNERYGSICKINYGMYQLVLTDDLKISKEILSEFKNRNPDKYYLHDFNFGKNIGLIVGNGKTQIWSKRCITPYLRKYGIGRKPNFEDFIQNELDLYFENIEKLRGQYNGVIKIRNLFQKPLINMIWQIICSQRFPYDSKELRKMRTCMEYFAFSVHSGHNICSAYPWLKYLPGNTLYSGAKDSYNFLHKMLNEIVDEKMAKFDFPDSREDIIDEILRDFVQKPEYEKNVTKELISSTCIDLLFGGSDTTSITLEFSIYYLLKNPRVYQKLMNEHDMVIGKDQRPSLKHKQSLQYLQAFTYEVSRMASVFPIAPRYTSEEKSICDGKYHFEKDTIVYVNIHSIHYDENLWDNPFEFKPERFINEENRNFVNTEKLLPFGYGKRSCIGENLSKVATFLYLTSFLQKYEFGFDPENNVLPAIETNDSLVRLLTNFKIFIKPRF